MKTNLRERLTGYQSFIRPKVHFALEFSFKFMWDYSRCIITEQIRPNKLYKIFLKQVYDVFS